MILQPSQATQHHYSVVVGVACVICVCRIPRGRFCYNNDDEAFLGDAAGQLGCAHCRGNVLGSHPTPCHVCLQNPKERISLGRMMKHPWVTRRGSWPLRTVKEMVQAGETPEQAPVLPDLMSTLNVLDVPRQVCVSLFLPEQVPVLPDPISNFSILDVPQRVLQLICIALFCR